MVSQNVLDDISQQVVLYLLSIVGSVRMGAGGPGVHASSWSKLLASL